MSLDRRAWHGVRPVCAGRHALVCPRESGFAGRGFARVRWSSDYTHIYAARIKDAMEAGSSGRADRIVGAFEKSSVILFRLPPVRKNALNPSRANSASGQLRRFSKLAEFVGNIGSPKKILAFLGSMHALPYVYNSIGGYEFLSLVSLDTKKRGSSGLFSEHEGLLLLSSGRGLLDVKQPYSYCKACGDTVKDYGGKRYLMSREGTRMSDVWKDSVATPSGGLWKLLDRLALITGTRRSDISFLDVANDGLCRRLDASGELKPGRAASAARPVRRRKPTNRIFCGDVLGEFGKIPDGCVDLVLVDPPYNLNVRYGRVRDDMEEEKYVEWSKLWIDQACRTLRPGGTLAMVNLPTWSMRLFPYLARIMRFQCWIVWDAWSVPRKHLISAHYPVLVFSKTGAAPTRNAVKSPRGLDAETTDLMFPLAEGYCIRGKCKSRRPARMLRDRVPLGHVWSDAHRIRHNSLRYNHPTLMPQKLALRAISLFSNPGDTVLDCFNGVGTTTLTAQMAGRSFIGIEKNRSYHRTSLDRHSALSRNLDPFARGNGRSTSAAKGYRPPKPQTHVPKKNLQLEVKRVCRMLGRCPSDSELELHGAYPLSYYYDNFRDRAEITVAARRTGI